MSDGAAERQPVPRDAGPRPASPRHPPGSPFRPRLREWLGSPIALLPLGLLGLVVGVLILASEFQNFGPSFFGISFKFIPGNPTGSEWGIGTFVVGTAITAGIALFAATLLSLALAISLVVYLPPVPSRVLTILTNLLAAIPSVVYGLWGFVVLAPYFGYTLEPTMRSLFGWIPGLGGPASEIGPWGLLLAIFLLTIMIIPLTTALMREALRGVPNDLIEAGLALGATRWEVARRVRMRHARLGIWSAILLGFGRAVGESVAVAMVIGAVPKLPTSIYSGSTTLASYIFYQLDSAFIYPDLLHLLVEFALVLLVIAVGVNLIAQRITRVEVATSMGVGGTHE